MRTQVRSRSLSLSPLHAILAVVITAIPLFFMRGIGVFDDSFYLKAGVEIARGSLLYRDIFENKTPLTFWLSAGLAKIAGGHWLVPRFFLFTLTLVLLLAFSRYVSRFFERRVAFLATALFATSYVLCQGYSLHTEQLCLASAFIAIALLTGEARESLWSWFFSGIFLALSFLSKQPAVLYLVGVCLHTGFAALRNPSERERVFGRTLTLSIAYGITILIPVLYFASRGAVGDMFDAIVRNTTHVALEVPPSFEMALRLWAQTPAISFSVLSLLALLCSAKLRAECLSDKNVSALSLWLVTSVVCLAANTRLQNTTGHYALPVIAGLSLVNGFVLGRCIAHLGRETELRWLWVADAAILLLFVPYVAAIGYGGIKVVREQRLKIDLQQRSEIQAALNKHTSPYEPVLVLSEAGAPRLYYLSDRPPLTKYMHFGVNFHDRFTLTDAMEILKKGTAKAALIDVPDPDGWFRMNAVKKYLDDDFALLKEKYEVVSLPNGRHPINRATTYLLVRKPHSEG